MMMIMIIGTSLWVFGKEDKHGTLLPPELGSESGARSRNGGGLSFADSCYCTALKSQFQAEEPSMTCMTPGCTRKPQSCLITQFSHLHCKCPGPSTSSSLFPTVRRLSGGVLSTL